MALSVSAIETAITAVLAGQSYTMGGITYTLANLSSLQALLSMAQSSAVATAVTRPLFRSFNFRNQGYAQPPEVD
jgi:hypothetical protein